MRLTDPLTGSLTPTAGPGWNHRPMATPPAPQRDARRWVVPFLAAFVAVLATLLSSASASAATTAGAETRVRASSVVVEVPVGPPQSVSAGERLGNEPARVVGVVATGVAANYGPQSVPIYRTPKADNVADELASGPNPLNHQAGDASAYFGERSVAGEFIGQPGYAQGMVRYDMHPDFLDRFADSAHRYDWQGPGGTARIEFQIPVGRLEEFGSLTLQRTWVPEQ